MLAISGGSCLLSFVFFLCFDNLFLFVRTSLIYVGESFYLLIVGFNSLKRGFLGAGVFDSDFSYLSGRYV